MTRLEELKKKCEELHMEMVIIENTLTEIVFLEERLKELKKLPFIKVHPRNPELQKPTAAAKQYKEFLQQYNNSIKVLCSMLHKGKDDNNESLLRMYLRTLEK